MKIKTNPVCRDCGAELNDENWCSSWQKKPDYICKRCHAMQLRQWRKANPEKAKANWTRYHRKEGQRPMNENKKCAAFLGVHVAERVLGYVFKHVEKMPYGNAGFDFICGGGYKIDVKSSCLQKSGRWLFTTNHNTIADYFLCLAFDNREDLNPLHAWLIRGKKINHLVGASISPSTIKKWDEYMLDTTKVVTCCNTLKNV